jgi:DNA mismatch repair protein MutS2
MAPSAPALPASHPDVAVPDLLHATPMVRVDVEATRLGLNLAFASGVSGGFFADALDHARMAPSTWQPAAFAGDLFLSHFVSACFKIRAAGKQPLASATHLVRVLSSPPSDVQSVDYRRAILGELSSNAALRAALENLYALLCRFRTLLEGARGAGWDVNRRQLDILQAGQEVIECMAKDFVSSRSGLSRLAVFGQRVMNGEPYRSLCDLLRYDENLATLDLKVGVGADGRIRGFRIVAIETNETNPFVTSAWRRWLAKFELFARGFQFGDGEVMARLIDAVFEGMHPEFVPFVQLLGEVEFYLGALGFAEVAKTAGLAVCLPALVKASDPLRYEGLFNPLLLSMGMPVVPCNLAIERHDTTTLVTGPNSGGKTRLLQSLGLTQILAQSGLFIPARAGAVALCPALVVSLIQETRADQSEGRLGVELVRIRALFERLPKGAMVILDELCSGTNPSEGEEIFELVVRMLTMLTPQVFITTHFLAFAGRLEQERRIRELRFLQVELGENHEPTYQFVPGVAKTSLAGHAAARLGVTAEQLMALIESNLSAPDAAALAGS